METALWFVQISTNNFIENVWFKDSRNDEIKNAKKNAYTKPLKVSTTHSVGCQGNHRRSLLSVGGRTAPANVLVIEDYIFVNTRDEKLSAGVGFYCRT